MAPKIVNTKFGIAPERLSDASPSRPACAECGLHRSCTAPFVKPYIPEAWTGKYAFVTETSREGDEEYNRTGIPLGQRERAPLKKILQEVGITVEDLALIPALRCRPTLTGSKKPKMHDIRACRPFLLRALTELNPETVVAFGETAVKALTNTGSPGPIAKLRGRQLSGLLEQVTEARYATSKVSSLLSDPHSHNRIREDLQRLTMPALAYPKKELPSGTEHAVGFDTEYGPGEVFTLGVSDSTRALACAPKHAAQLLKLLGHSTVVGHNLPVDLEALIRLRVKGFDKPLEQWLQGRQQRDTLLEARLADENRGKHGYKLESLAVSLFNVKDWKGPTEALGPDASKWPPVLRDERCRLDAWATLKVHQVLAPLVEGPSRLSHEIAMSLRRMYFAGVYIDGKKFTTFKKEVDAKREESLAALTVFVKKFKLQDFSPTNDNCVREYVYGDNGVGLDVESFTKGGLPSVSAKVLKEYKNDSAIQALLVFSKYDKLQSTYTTSLSDRFVKTPTPHKFWMPVSINPLAAKTGRRTSAAPNFQNWPVSVRQVIVSRFPGGNIADNDFSKLEPILGGWVADEPKLTDYFVKYPNGYVKIGEDFFKKTVEKNTKEYTMMKSLVLAIIYKKMKWSLGEDLWVNYDGAARMSGSYDDHVDKCGQVLDDFLDMFPGIKRYHKAQEEAVLDRGMVYNALGQCRRLPLPPEPPRSEKGAYKAWMRYKAHVINQAVNYPIQSLASYVTGCGLIDLERAFLTEWKYSYVEYQTALMEKKWPRMPLLQIEVHDDLVQDIPKGLDKKTKEITHDIMTKPPSLFAVLPELFDSNVKLSVDTNVGPCWGLKS